MEKAAASEKVIEMIVDKRKELGISRYKLAQLLDVPEDTPKRWEEGKVSPSASTLIRIMHLTDQSIDELDEKLRIRKAAKKAGI